MTDKYVSVQVELIKSLCSEIELNTCAHESTHRGGAIWEICDDCGAKWADDEGGKPEFKWPECYLDAKEIIEAAPYRIAHFRKIVELARLPEFFVQMPSNADQAELMAKTGLKWLEDNAPERLKPASADKYVRVPVEAVEQIAEIRDTAMRNIGSSPMKYSADWAEVAQLFDWLCGEIEATTKPVITDPWKEAVINECMISECCLIESDPVQTVRNLMLHAQDVGQAASAEPVAMPYLMLKGGMWYGHNSSGYTARAELAELYTKEYAESHASHHEDVAAIPLNEIIGSAEMLDPFIMRMQKMQEALKCAVKPQPPEVG